MPLLRWLTVTFAALALTIALTVAAATPAKADPALFAVAGVAVDETAASAAQAREQALAEGHREAFRRLLARLVPRGRLDGVPRPPDEAIANLVRDFEVSDERTSNVRYLAELSFRFRPEAVRAFLRENAIPYAEARSRPVVVLPLYGAAGEAVLWEEPNPWREVWTEEGMDRVGLVPFEVPLGDLGDMQAISAEVALSGDRDALRRIAERYGGEHVLVTQAIQGGDPDEGTASAQIISSRVEADGESRNMVESIRQREDEPLAEMYGRAVESVARALEEDWKQANLLRFEDRRELTAAVPLNRLADWVQIERQLASVPLIGESRLRTLSRERAEIELVYFGDSDQLRLALARNGLRLDDGEDGEDGDDWVLRSARAVAEPAIGRDDPAGEVGTIRQEPAVQ